MSAPRPADEPTAEPVMPTSVRVAVGVMTVLALLLLSNEFTLEDKRRDFDYY